MSISNLKLSKSLMKQVVLLGNEYPKIYDYIHRDRFELRDIDSQKRYFEMEGEEYKGSVASWHKNVFYPELFIRNRVYGNNIKRIEQELNKNGVVSEDLNHELILDEKRIQFFSAWAVTKGIYSIDESLSEAIFNEFVSPQKDVLNFFPIDLIETIPEWCMYFTFTKRDSFELFGAKIHGFFVLINHYCSENRKLSRFDSFEVCFCFHDGGSGFLNLDIPINESIPFSVLVIETIKKYARREPSKKDIELFSMMANKAISMLMYICTKKPEYSGLKPSFPKPVKTKKGLRFFPPDKPKIIEIGKSIGEKLRQYEAAQEKQFIESGATKRPHIRRGHWHGVWTGARNSETPQTFKYNWLPPMGVNIEGGI